MDFEVLLRNYNDSIDHCIVFFALLIGILLSVSFLQMNELVWGGYSVTFREFQIELLAVNFVLLTKDALLSLRFSPGLADSRNRHPIYVTSRTGQHS